MINKEFWITHGNEEFSKAKRTLEEVDKHFQFWVEKKQYGVMERAIRNLIQGLASTLFFMKELERMDK